MEHINQHYNRLVRYIRQELGPCAVALSGGTDSELLLRAAAEAHGGKPIALTVVTPYTIRRDHDASRILTHTLAIRHVVIELAIPGPMLNNPENRCYVCKRTIMSAMYERAVAEGFKVLVEGTNADDVFLDRPGMRALRELGVKSPLLECSITKDDVRRCLKVFDHVSAERQANSCLMTRLPHGAMIDESDLKQVALAEEYLLALGLTFVRVRKYGRRAVIEIDPSGRETLFRRQLDQHVISRIRKLGFDDVVIDKQNQRSQ